MIVLAPDAVPGFGAVPIATIAWTEENFFTGLSAAPLVIGSGLNADSNTLNLAGYDAFMGILNCSGAGATVAVSILMLHPLTLATIATRVITAGVAPSASLVTTFGAYNAVSANDIYGKVKIRFGAVSAAVTITGLVLYGQVR